MPSPAMPKRTWSLLLLSIALCSFAATPAMSEDQSRRTISISGEAEVRVVPDEVILTIGLETWDFNLDAAKKLNDDCTNAVVLASRKHRIEERNIQTDYLTIEPRYSWRDRQAHDFIGYFVRKRLVITITGLWQVCIGW